MSSASVPIDLRRRTPSHDARLKSGVMMLRPGGALEALRSVQGLREVPPSVVHAFRPSVPTLADRITTRIQQEVAAFAGRADADRRELISFAVHSAADLFLDLLEGRPVSGHRVDKLFRRMGRAEAMDGRGLDAVRAACQIASRDAWLELRHVAESGNLPGSVLGPLGDTLFAYLQHLVDQVQLGYVEAQRERGPERVRRQLLHAMLAGKPEDEICTLADVVAWDVPHECVVLGAAVPADMARAVEVPSHVLVGISHGYAIVVVAADKVGDGLAVMRNVPCVLPIARSWPVSTADVRHAHRWTRRALSLARHGLIACADVIDCSEYRSALWLHADPVLRRAVCDDLLAPLLAEKQHQRAVLAETLLLWLRTHASAPALAEQIGVHEQTVRRRLRRLRADFASALAEPSQKVGLLMVLEAIAPAWLTQAGLPSHLVSEVIAEDHSRPELTEPPPPTLVARPGTPVFEGESR